MEFSPVMSLPRQCNRSCPSCCKGYADLLKTVPFQDIPSLSPSFAANRETKPKDFSSRGGNILPSLSGSNILPDENDADYNLLSQIAEVPEKRSDVLNVAHDKSIVLDSATEHSEMVKFGPLDSYCDANRGQVASYVDAYPNRNDFIHSNRDGSIREPNGVNCVAGTESNCCNIVEPVVDNQPMESLCTFATSSDKLSNLFLSKDANTESMTIELNTNFQHKKFTNQDSHSYLKRNSILPTENSSSSLSSKSDSLQNVNACPTAVVNAGNQLQQCNAYSSSEEIINPRHNGPQSGVLPVPTSATRVGFNFRQNVFCCKLCTVTHPSLDQFRAHTCKDADDCSSSQLDQAHDCSPAVARSLVEDESDLPHSLTCCYCGVQFRTLLRISYHLLRCGPGPYYCPCCGEQHVSRPTLHQHMRDQHKKEKCFKCCECEKAFERRSSLEKHLVSWHESSSASGPFKCDLCSKKFVRRIYLTNHKIRMHKLQKNYLCKDCGSRFLNEASLRVHSREQHETQLKQHVCNLCNKTFTRKEKLVLHQRLHSGERPFTCTQCGLHFVSRSKLNEHTNKHHPVSGGRRRFYCPHCKDKSYANCSDLRKHVRKMHDTELSAAACIPSVAPPLASASSTVVEIRNVDSS